MPLIVEYFLFILMENNMLNSWPKSSLARLREIIQENRDMSNLTNITAIESVCIAMVDSDTMTMAFADRLLERVRGGEKLIPVLGDAVHSGACDKGYADQIIKSVRNAL
jgi:hypothetical protein